ncbi:threonine/serine ThrE exporter family protein [Niveibacterium terrae]|uniref:threonine/serine ThrE exporter family protein n=1 Tax=Niveibacterium terrae TaxID=3373598 RepID=UPI003A950752
MNLRQEELLVREDDALRFLQLTSRLLLQYNFRSELIKRKIALAAKHLGVAVQVFVAYRGVTLYAEDGQQLHAQASEFRINVAVSTEVNWILERLGRGELSLAEATVAMSSVEARASRHNRHLVALIFGLAASALAWLNRADLGAILVSGLSSGLGVLARLALARHHPVLFAMPFSAALIGAVMGGTVIRLGWTETPGFCLMVPALMLVPGPHLINGLYDMVENHMQTGISRLGLAAGILVAAAMGIFLGGWLVLGMTTVSARPSEAVHMTLALDVLLAGVAACGFGLAFNEPWKVLWISIFSGMLGHGVRFLAMGCGQPQEIATLFACLVIGAIAGVAVDRGRLPFAAVAFAGAVPMMPGFLIYQGFEGAMLIARSGAATDPALIAGTLAFLFKAAFVVGSMALGLLAGGRIAVQLSARLHSSRGDSTP